MTDRYNSLTVILERDIREDDAEPIINSIKMIKGVANVIPGMLEGNDITKEQARLELVKKIYKVLSVGI